MAWSFNSKVRQTAGTLGTKSLKIFKLEGECREEERNIQHSKDLFLTWKRALRKLNLFVLISQLLFNLDVKLVMYDSLRGEDAAICFSTIPGLCTCLAFLPK